MTDNQLAIRQQNALASPATLDDLTARAALIVKGGLAPKGLDTPEKVAVVMLKGAELGLKPMQSLSDIYVVNGQPSLGTKLLAALFKRAGNDYTIIERTPERVTVRFFMRNGRTYDHTLTMAEAQAARWPMQWNNQKNTWEEKATWKGMPMVMLTYRALSTGIRMLAPEVLHGMVTDDEADDPVLAVENTVIEGEARVVKVVEPLAAGGEGDGSDNGNTNNAKPATPVSVHWAQDARVMARFWPWVEKQSLTQSDVLTALGVDRLTDYDGGMLQAKKQIEAWVARQLGEEPNDDGSADH